MVDVAGEGKIWREGNLLVIERNARLPPRCVKCDTSNVASLEARRLVYYPRWVLLVVPLNWMIAGILVWLLSQSVPLRVGVCNACLLERRAAIGWAWLLSAMAILWEVPFVFVIMRHPEWELLATLVALSGCLALGTAAAIVAVIRGQLLVVRSMCDQELRLSGVSSDDLADLPSRV